MISAVITGIPSFEAKKNIAKEVVFEFAKLINCENNEDEFTQKMKEIFITSMHLLKIVEEDNDDHEE